MWISTCELLKILIPQPNTTLFVMIPPLPSSPSLLGLDCNPLCLLPPSSFLSTWNPLSVAIRHLLRILSTASFLSVATLSALFVLPSSLFSVPHSSLGIILFVIFTKSEPRRFSLFLSSSLRPPRVFLLIPHDNPFLLSYSPNASVIFSKPKCQGASPFMSRIYNFIVQDIQSSSNITSSHDG